MHSVVCNTTMVSCALSMLLIHLFHNRVEKPCYKIKSKLFLCKYVLVSNLEMCVVGIVFYIAQLKIKGTITWHALPLCVVLLGRVVVKFLAISLQVIGNHILCSFFSFR